MELGTTAHVGDHSTSGAEAGGLLVSAQHRENTSHKISSDHYKCGHTHTHTHTHTHHKGPGITERRA